MPLSNPRFLNEPILKDCFDGKRRLTLGDKGPHVKKVQQALLDLGLKLPVFGADSSYGRETAQAVFEFKQARGLRNSGGTIDGIVGPKTMDRLDQDAPRSGGGGGGGGGPAAPSKQDIIRSAFDRSRASLRVVVGILQRLEEDISRAVRADGTEKILLMAAIGRVHPRNIAVISRRMLVSADPLSAEFRDVLAKVKDLVQRNLNETSGIIDQGKLNRCDPSLPGRSNQVPHAATQRTDPDPRVSVCDPFFVDSADLQRDVITHEFFHLLGLADKSVNNTNDALTNANTVAQVVALLHDRSRQANSDGGEPAVPPLPSP